MFCGKCGSENPDKAAFCKNCGARLNENPKPATDTMARVPVNTQREGTRKRRPVLTTRKTSTPYLRAQMVGDSLFIGLAVFCFIRAGELIDSYWYRSEGETLQTAGFVCFVVWLLSMTYHMMVSRTYLDLFDGRISGSGMQGIQCKSFELRFDQIVGISVSKGFLNLESGIGAFIIVNTSAGDYKIITTNARANEIAEYYSNASHRPRPRRER